MDQFFSFRPPANSNIAGNYISKTWGGRTNNVMTRGTIFSAEIFGPTFKQCRKPLKKPRMGNKYFKGVQIFCIFGLKIGGP